MEPAGEVRLRVVYLAFHIIEQASPLGGSFQWWMNRFLLQVRAVPEEEQVEYCFGEEIALQDRQSEHFGMLVVPQKRSACEDGSVC
jgi:hypothetical protein